MTDSTRNWIAACAAMLTAAAASTAAIVVAGIGADIQKEVAEQGGRANYLMLAAQILSVRESAEKDEQLRGWAVCF